MKFKFKFQKLLEIKEKLEEAKKNEIASLNLQIKEMKEKINFLESEKKEKILEIQKKTTDGINIMDLRMFNLQITAMESKIEKKRLDLIQIQEILLERKNEYKEIMQSRKSFENLREKDIEQFKQELKKEEEQSIDQLVSFKSNKRS